MSTEYKGYLCPDPHNSFHAHKLEKEVGVCGNVAGDPTGTRVLIGVGIRELSMSPSSILEIKKNVRAKDSQVAKKLTDKLIQLPSSTEIVKHLRLQIEKLVNR